MFINLVTYVVAFSLGAFSSGFSSIEADYDHDFWVLFAEGDAAIDVPSYMWDGLVLDYVDPDHGLINVDWNATTESFDVMLGGEWLTVVLTGTDADNRPRFTGGDSLTNIVIDGLVDVGPSNMLMVEITIQDVTTRFLTTESTGGVPEESAQCKCPDEAHSEIVCGKRNCDKNPPTVCVTGDPPSIPHIRCKFF